MNITGQRILISPNAKASQRTKNRIREHGGNGFRVIQQGGVQVFGLGDDCWHVVASDGWNGWIPKAHFHLEAWGEEWFVNKF